jgi:hypothetical protein
MAAVSGAYLFLTYYLQATLGYSPVTTGFAYMPLMAAAMVAGIASNVVLLPRTGPRLPVVVGMLLAATGMIWLTRIGLHSSFASALLGPLVLMGLGLGLVIAPANNTATFRLPPADAGVGSAMANTQQQIGLSLGTALLNTMAVSATTHYLISNERLATRPLYAKLVRLAAVDGYITAFWWAAGIFVAGAIICAMLFRPGVLAGQGDSTQVAVLDG